MPHALGFDSLDPFFRVSKQGVCFTAIEEEGSYKRLADLELAYEALSVDRQILFSLAITVIAEEILMQISAEQVPSLHRVAPRYLKLLFWSVMLIFALMLFVLLVTILLSSALTSIPYVIALSTSLLVRSESSPLLLPIR